MATELETRRFEFAALIDNEGLGYTIAHYLGKDISDEDLEDEAFVEAWSKAYDAIALLEARIEEWQEYDVDDDDA